MTVYVTKFNPHTRQVIEGAKDSGFDSLETVELLLGAPIVRGKRALTYKDMFYSEYCIHQTNDPQRTVFLNREA